MTRAEPVVLVDGREAVLRPLTSDDRPALQVLFGDTSPDNLYSRFFGLGADTVSKHLDHLFSDDQAVLTYIVTDGVRILGVADVEIFDRVSAEVAFLVADDTHGCGVATLLLERAAGDARNIGIEWFVADVFAVNHSMLQVFTDIGFAVELDREGYDVNVRMSTKLDRTARDAYERRREHTAVRGEPVTERMDVAGAWSAMRD